MTKLELLQLEKSLRELNKKVPYLSDEYMAIQKGLYVTINLIIDIEQKEKQMNDLQLNEESLWDNDTIQFARLINELDLLGIFFPDTLRDLAYATDLSQIEILELIERAKIVYDETLENL